jgi:hypothetical protein
MTERPLDPYRAASLKLKAEGFVWNVETGFYERGVERVTLTPKPGDDPIQPTAYVVKRWPNKAAAHR